MARLARLASQVLTRLLQALLVRLARLVPQARLVQLAAPETRVRQVRPD